MQDSVTKTATRGKCARHHVACPSCGARAGRVTDTRVFTDGQGRWRRRKCGACGERWTTLERNAQHYLPAPPAPRKDHEPPALLVWADGSFCPVGDVRFEALRHIVAALRKAVAAAITASGKGAQG